MASFCAAKIVMRKFEADGNGFWIKYDLDAAIVRLKQGSDEADRRADSKLAKTKREM